MAKKKNTKVVSQVEIKYSKEQIVNSNKYKANVDLLNAILKNNRQYTLQEVNEIINNFKKGKV